MKPGESQSGRERWINVRKLAALDIVFHGPRLILAEFALGIIVCAGIGLFILGGFFRSPDHPLFAFLLGIFLLFIALNYVPLFLYAISIVKGNTAQQEVAYELEHKEVYARKYTFQSLLLLVPLIVPILAIYQEYRKRLPLN